LQPGLQRLEIANLPLGLDPASARASAYGSARARLLGFQLNKTFYSDTPADAPRQLQEQLEAAQDEARALQAQLALSSEARTRLDAIAAHTDLFATALASGEQTVEEQLALFDTLRRKAAELDAERQALLLQQRTLERRIEQLKRQLDQQASQRPRERYSAWVELEVQEAGEMSVALSAIVFGAGWTPLYDLRLAENGAAPELEVGYLAEVRQASGEDWTDVALTLSTARPALAGSLPELDPWFIAPRPPRPAAPVRMAAHKALAADENLGSAPPPAVMLAMSAPPAPAEEALAAVDDSGAAVTYRVPGTVSVPSDGGRHKVTVARYMLKPRLDYVTAPVQVEAAYRRALVTNDSPYTLLTGPANLFIGDEFIGAAQLELTAPRCEIELYLGVDDRVKVERELKRREVDKTLLGGRRRVQYGFEVRLENLSGAPVRVTLHDRMPVGRHEEIKVRLTAADPQPTRHSELNLLDWELTLGVKEKRSVRFDFQVEYPQAMDIPGLS
ncbi:MAG: mucoidy inhibitor MuiA family protein, partial [Chloroflexota bacterium]